MARSLPLVRAGRWFHLVNRGVSGSELFPTPQAAAAFVAALGEIAEQFPVEIHAYCAMGNHYHLLARAQEEELQRAVLRLEGSISGNTEHARLHRLAVGRHLLDVTRYIHRNPVEARLVKHPSDWRWSSYRGYLDRLDGPPWLRSSVVLAWLGSIGARQLYRRYVEGNGPS